MPGNPKTSKWRSTPEAARRRKHVAVTLSDAARAKLDRLAVWHPGGRSGVVEDLIMEAKE